MKRFIVYLLICFLFLISGCDVNSYSEIEGISESEQHDNIFVDYSISLNDEEFEIEDISSIIDAYDFDDTVFLISNYYGIDINSQIENSINVTFDYGDNIVSYIGDYDMLLSEETIPDYCGVVWYRPRESEYHQCRRFAINDFSIDEFEDSSWAVADYLEKVNMNYSYDNTVIEALRDSSELDGYFFIIGELIMNRREFFAIYYLDTCTITYSWSFNREDYDDYRTYLEICEILGLPTSDEATLQILGEL